MVTVSRSAIRRFVLYLGIFVVYVYFYVDSVQILGIGLVVLPPYREAQNTYKGEILLNYKLNRFLGISLVVYRHYLVVEISQGESTLGFNPYG